MVFFLGGGVSGWKGGGVRTHGNRRIARVNRLCFMFVVSSNRESVYERFYFQTYLVSRSAAEPPRSDSRAWLSGRSTLDVVLPTWCSLSDPPCCFLPSCDLGCDTYRGRDKSTALYRHCINEQSDQSFVFNELMFFNVFKLRL